MNSRSSIAKKLLLLALLPLAAVLLVFELYLALISNGDHSGFIAALQWRVFEVGAAAGIFAAAIAWLLARSSAKRIRRLANFAEGLGRTHSAELDLPDSGDELGLLAASLRRVSDDIGGLVDRLSQESERRDAIFSSMIEGVLAVDNQLRVTFYNNSFQRLIGGPAPPLNRPISLVELVRDSEMIEMLRGVIASHQPASRRLELPTAEGRVFEAYAGPLGGASSRGAIAILHDITNLERLERVRKDFVANVSHELRTPLTAICGYAETLLEGALDDPENNRKFVEVIRAHANRINVIASDLLTLSELEGSKKAPPYRISVGAALQTALRAVEPEAKLRGIKISCGRVDDADVIGYRVYFEQGLLNLLQNAVKFNREGGSVAVSAVRTDDDRICIAISDTGIGIPSEDLSRIFERFYRVDKARSRDVGGTGLGLSIVKHVVERMNGTIAVESQIGKGSEFKILLAVAGAAPDASQATLREAETTPAKLG